MRSMFLLIHNFIFATVENERKEYKMTRPKSQIKNFKNQFPGRLLKSPFRTQVVIPAEAGIQSFQDLLDSGFRRSDGESEFFHILLESKLYGLLSMSLCIIRKTPDRILLAEEKIFRRIVKGAEIGEFLGNY